MVSRTLQHIKGKKNQEYYRVVIPKLMLQITGFHRPKKIVLSFTILQDNKGKYIKLRPAKEEDIIKRVVDTSTKSFRLNLPVGMITELSWEDVQELNFGSGQDDDGKYISVKRE